MLNNFRAYQEALKFYEVCESIRGAQHLRIQLLRSSSSITLNLAEGSSQASAKNRARFYRIALGSLREAQAALAMMNASPAAQSTADRLGAILYRLVKAAEPRASTP